MDWHPAYMAQSIKAGSSVLAGDCLLCIDDTMLNNLARQHQGSGGWFNDRTRIALVAFDYELSTRPVLKHGPRSLTCARAIGN